MSLTRAQLVSQIATLLADNTNGDITELDVRNTFDLIISNQNNLAEDVLVNHDPQDPITFSDLKGRQIGTPSIPVSGSFNLDVTDAVPGASAFFIYNGATAIDLQGATVIDWTADQFVANELCIYFIQYLASGGLLLTGIFPEKKYPPENESISAARAITAADYKKTLRLDAAANQNIELPDDAHLTNHEGFYVSAEKIGAGDLEFVGTGVATVLGDKKISTQYQVAMAERVAPNTWRIVGGNA